MAKDDKDPGTVDAFPDPTATRTLSPFEKEAARREYLRQKKAESRARARKASHMAKTRHDPNIPDQVTLTLSTGAKAILSRLARNQGVSMSAVVEQMMKANTAKTRRAREELLGLDWSMWRP